MTVWMRRSIVPLAWCSAITAVNFATPATGIDDINHPTLRIVNRCLGNVDQQPLLPVDPLDVARDRADHLPA